MKRTKWVTGLSLVVVLWAASLPPPAAGRAYGVPTATDGISLAGCLLSGVNFEDSRQRIQREGWVPEGYPFLPAGADGAILLIWTFSCDDAAVGRHQTGPLSLAVVGVALEYTDRSDPKSWPNAFAPDWPGNWGIYVVGMYADDAVLVTALRAAGMPAEKATDISFTEADRLPSPSDTSVALPRTDTCNQVGPAPGLAHSPPDQVRAPEPHKHTTVTVDSPGAAIKTATEPLVHHNAVTHCHDQILWHGPWDSPAQVHVSIPVARDHFCQHSLPQCGEAQVSGRDLEGFLGATGRRSDPTLAFDHERIERVLLTPKSDR